MEKISADPRHITEAQALCSAIAMSLWMFWGTHLIAGDAADHMIYLLPAMAIAIAAVPEIRLRLLRRRVGLSAATYRPQVLSSLE